MNEDEVKVINRLKQTIDFNSSLYIDDLGDNDIKIILNLVEKQQKEIEEKNIAINKMSKDISKQLEEIEEKTTILLAGAEKVKQLEKEIEELKTKLEIEKIDNKYNQEERDEETIPRYKIREKIEELESFDKAMHQKNGQFTILVLQGLLKEEDGDHIPRID